ncbi:MAG TPA: hypothetical protein PLA54_15305, partial [Spirochaetota bacterium]|nr:hypothetical protein [Spirochaetota bacterium]
MKRISVACIMIGLLGLIGCSQLTSSSSNEKELTVYTAKPALNSNYPWEDSSIPYTDACISFSKKYYQQTVPGGVISVSSSLSENVNGIDSYAICDSPGVYWFKFSNFRSNCNEAEFVCLANATINGQRYSYEDNSVDVSEKKLYSKNGVLIASLQTIVKSGENFPLLSGEIFPVI